MKLKAAAQWMLAILLMAPCMQAQSVWNTTHLANVKRSIREPFYATAYETLKKEADRLSDAQPLSVMMKEKTPASGDKHDYMSQARYFWPDPAKPDGLPYINRDGIQHLYEGVGVYQSVAAPLVVIVPRYHLRVFQIRIHPGGFVQKPYTDKLSSFPGIFFFFAEVPGQCQGGDAVGGCSQTVAVQFVQFGIRYAVAVDVG